MSESEHEHSKLAELLLRLQEDYKLLAEFDKDPDKVMIEAGISSEEYYYLKKEIYTLVIANKKKKMKKIKNIM